MTAPTTRAGFVALLTEIRSAGPDASREQVERAFDRCLPALVRAADPYEQEALSEAAQARIVAAILSAGAPPLPRPATRRWPWLAALAAGLLVAFTLWLAGVFTPEALDHVATVPEAARFSAVTGEPVVRAPGADRVEQALHGQAIAYGSRVETGDADLVELRFADGTTIGLDFNTIVELPPAPAAGLSLPPRPHLVTVERGRILARVTHLADERHFQVATPVATAEVLGTEFALALERGADDSAPLRAVLEVRRGQVAFYNDLGRVLVTDLMRTGASRGSAPSEPQRIQAFRSLHHMERNSLAGTTAPLSVVGACLRTAPPPGLASLFFRDTDDGRVVIARVLGGSHAQQAGLQVGDEVRSIGGDAVSDAWSAMLAVLRRPESRVAVQAARDGVPFEVTFLFRAWSPGDLDDGLRLEQQVGLAALLELQRDREPARQALQALIERDPHPAYWNNLGLLWQVDDRLGPALRCFAEAVRLAPERELFRFNYGLALQSIGNLARAAEELRAASRLAPQWLNAKLALVEVLMLHEQPEAALIELDGLEQALPSDSANILLKRSTALLRLGRAAEARAALERALDAEPNSPSVLHSLCIVLDAQGDLDGAIRYMERALELDPGSAAAATNLGALYWRADRIAEAERVLLQAIALEPTDPVAHMNLGLVFQSLDRPAEAEAEYKRALEVNPEYGDTYGNYGYLLWRIGRVDEGERLLRKCLELDPRYALACANLGSLLTETDRRAEAVALYREFLRVTPGVGMILNNLAFVLAELGTDLDEALAAANAAVDAAPQRPTRHHTLGSVLAARGELEPAEAAFLRALDLYGAVQDAGKCWEELGLARERRGDADGAKQAYRKALELDAALEQARAALQRLGG